MSVGEKGIKNDLTVGSVPKELLGYALPFMAANALQAAYAVADMIIVGRYVGTAALTAVSTACRVVTLITMLSMGFCTGGQVRVAKAVGNSKGINRAVGTLYTFILIAAAVASVVGVALCSEILKLLKTPEESFADARAYLIITSAGIVFPFGYNAVSAVLRGLGDSVRPLIYIAVSACVNVGLNFLFVVGCDLGAVGAAWATVTGQAVAFFIAVGYVFVKKEQVGFDFRAASFIPDKDEAKALMKLGIPFVMRSGAVNVSMTVLTAVVNASGVSAGALFGVGVQTDDFCRKIAIGINYSVTTFVAQNESAGKYSRVGQSVLTGIAYAFCVYFVFGMIYIFCPQSLFRLFTTDAEVLDGARTFARAILWAFPAMITMRATNGYVQGEGKSVLSFVLALTDGVVLRIGLCYLLGVTCGLGTYGLFLGYGLASYGSAVPGAVYFCVRERRRRK